MKGRIPRAFGSALLLLGAFAVGGVVHEAAVEGTIDPLSPVAVFGVLGGVLLIVVGVRLERAFDPSDYVPEPAEAEDEESTADAEWGPVSDEMLEGREADDEYEER